MRIGLTVLALSVCAFPVRAEVVRSAPTSFVVEHKLDVSAAPETVWAMLGKPSRWWSPKHSWSGDVANFSMDLKPGGCFCEALPDGGGVEHARVVYAAPGRMLRLSGALGPLQAEGITGALTFALAADGKGGTTLDVRYAVNGDAGMPVAGLAAAVDQVIGEQAQRLKQAVEAKD